ncbi:hypothetical protein [Tenacibaculum finnmarkense]|uniref:hypothetical protein n=1 Tax=Tenacibaculum finnmarkense TaxID=2781243 RepID=UPI002079CBFB|nr:hypothetical protein [Tenacibaculum finnmarkense]MCM8906787.1 hypothetical protein [Tenacibaculum finnmarkense genomovar finnmarkense]
MSSQTSSKKLPEILTDAIVQEPFFNKEVLQPKIRSLISGFRLDLNTTNYNSIESPSKTAKLIRDNELRVIECKFWRKELKKIVGPEKMNDYYSEINKRQLK